MIILASKGVVSDACSFRSGEERHACINYYLKDHAYHN